MLSSSASWSLLHHPKQPPGFEAHPQHQLLLLLTSEICCDKHLTSSASPPLFLHTFQHFWEILLQISQKKREQREITLSMFPGERPGRERDNQLKVIVSCSPQGFILFLPYWLPDGVRSKSSYDQCRSFPEVQSCPSDSDIAALLCRLMFQHILLSKVHI